MIRSSDNLDWMFLFLVLGGFVILLWLGVPIWWALCIIIFFGLVYLGLRYPRGKEDWRYNFRETLYIVMTLITMFIFIIAIQAALRSIGGNLPSAVTLLTYVIIMPVMIILFLLGLFFPSGKVFNLKKMGDKGI
jgi:hypothetical protein